MHALQHAGQQDTPSSSVISCVQYFSTLGLLAAGTSTGEVALWSYEGHHRYHAQTDKTWGEERLQQDPATMWRVQKHMRVPGQVNTISFSLESK